MWKAGEEDWCEQSGKGLQRKAWQAIYSKNKYISARQVQVSPKYDRDVKEQNNGDFSAGMNGLHQVSASRW
jgi:hypothetical protein